jgi:hypothetical protein
MDLAWIACIALLWGLLILMVWAYQRLVAMSRSKSPPPPEAEAPFDNV